MNTRTIFFFLLAILCLALSTAAFADITLFTSGPINGNYNALFIDGPGGPFGQSVSDGFVATGTGNAAWLNFGEWTLGGAPTIVSWSLGTTFFGSQISSGGRTGIGSTFLGTNGFGYGMYSSQIAISGSLVAGQTYFMTLTRANDVGGSQFDAWDDNESPNASCYFEDHDGNIFGCPTNESESFTVSAFCPCGCGVPSLHCGEAVPEPRSILLFGSGMLGLAGVLRRKLHF